MPNTTVTSQIIDPVDEDVEELERAIEGALVHIAGPETITGLKTFTQAVTAPEFIGVLRGDIIDGRLTSNLDLNGFLLIGLGGVGLEELANKGVPNGYAPLGPTGLVPDEFLGTGGAGAGDNFLADDGTYKPISAGAVSFGTQVANAVFSGPGSGAAAAPGFRALVAADIPTLPQAKITDLVTDLLAKVPTARTITEGAGLAGNVYDLSANRTLAMGTPSTLAIATTNSVSGTTHSHAITSSSNPGASAKLLATDGSGFLVIPRLTLTDRLLINALTANLFLKDTSTGFQAAITGIVTPQPNNIWRNTSYVSGLSGWNIDDAGRVEFEDGIFRGELKSSVLKVNEITATAGTLGVFYSASTLENDFSTPANIDDPFDFDAKNSDAGVILFGVGDRVLFKAWTGSGVSVAWAIITARVNHTTYTTYTATLKSGSTSVTFTAGTAIADYGPSGTGFITLSADGTVGSSPNMTMATHAGSPWSAQTLLMRAGNLNGSYGYATNVHGVGIGEYGAAQSWMTFDTTNGLRIGNNTTTLAQWDASGNIIVGEYGVAGKTSINIDTSEGIRIFNNTTKLGQWDLAGNITVGQVGASQNNVYISGGVLEVRNNTTARIRLVADGSGYLANSLIAWDTSGNLTISGNATIAGWSVNSTYFAKDTGTNSTSAGMAPLDYPFFAGATYANRATAPFRVTPAGAMTSTSGTIGGFTIGPDYIRDNADSFGLASTVTGGDDVRFWAGNTFANRAAAPFRLTEAGALVATSATISGAITASSGSVTGVMSVTGAGSFQAGGGLVRLDSTGLNLDASTSGFAAANSVTWKSSGNIVGSVSSTFVGSAAYTSLFAQSIVNSGTSSSVLKTENDNAKSAYLEMILGGSTAIGGIADKAFVRVTGTSGTLLGMTIGSATAPAHMLDVYGDGYFHATTNQNVWLRGVVSLGTGVTLQSINDAGSANLPLELRSTFVAISVGGLMVGGTTDPGVGRLGIINTSAPSTPTGGGIVYCESGALKYKGTSGTVTTLGVA